MSTPFWKYFHFLCWETTSTGHGNNPTCRAEFETAVSLRGKECEPTGRNARFLSPFLLLPPHFNSIHGTWERQQEESPDSHSEAGSRCWGLFGTVPGGTQTCEPPLNQTGGGLLCPCAKGTYRCLSIAIFSHLIPLTFWPKLYFGLFMCCGCVWRMGWGGRCCSVPSRLFSSILSA